MFSRRHRRLVSTLKGKTVVKHIVDWTDLATTPTTQQNHVMVNCVDNPTQASVTDVAVGSQVFNLIVQFNFAHRGAAGGTSNRWDWYIFYNPQGKYTAPFPAPNNLGTNDIRNYVFKTGMEMSNQQTTVILKGFVKIPQKWTKMKHGDQLVFVYAGSDATATSGDQCGHVIFKEYR